MGMSACSNRPNTAHARSGRTAGASSVILPDPGLLGCVSGCRLWLDKDAAPGAVHPIQLMFDINGNSPNGVMAEYDKSVGLDEARDAINRRYARWASPYSATKTLWRVEDDKFAISLSKTWAGNVRVVYLAFR